jgi:hypothetical protein
MNNVINYFYEINIMDIYKCNDEYMFEYNGNSYKFIRYDRNIVDLKGIIEVCEELKKRNVITNELVLNRFNNYVTNFNGELYILVRQKVREYNININDIIYIQNNTLNISINKNLIRTNCIKLWENKIDFYEKKSTELSNKYELVYRSIDYYIGLGENAIAYLRNSGVIINNVVLSHRRLKDFYNPLNYIVDSRARDIADYIKMQFFYNNISEELVISILKSINFNREEYILLIARMLYPTFYFDLIDKMMILDCDEEIIRKVISKNDQYIKLIKDLLVFINYNLRMNIPVIEWIIKK